MSMYDLHSIGIECNCCSIRIICMTTHFIEAEIDLQATPVELKKEIEAEPQKRGEPLRWAITEVDQEEEKVRVEAVVTQD